jgi:hypothetical protein
MGRARLALLGRFGADGTVSSSRGHSQRKGSATELLAAYKVWGSGDTKREIPVDSMTQGTKFP